MTAGGDPTGTWCVDALPGSHGWVNNGGIGAGVQEGSAAG